MKYIKPKNYEGFITELKELGNAEKQIEAIGQYFLNCVEYDYVKLELINLGRMFTEVEAIDELFDCKNPQQRKNAIKYLRAEFNVSDEAAKRIEKEYGVEYTVLPTPEKKFDGITVKASSAYETMIPLAGAIGASVENIQATIKEGMLTKGVCGDYQRFVSKICEELGIPCIKVHGTTTVGHAWNKIKIFDEAKHYDFTYAIFVRDDYHYEGQSENIVFTDWLGMTDEKLFSLQPIRKIDYTSEDMTL